MGVVIRLAARTRAHSPATARKVAFHFDLGCPFSYLAAEQVERCLGEVSWRPVGFGEALPRDAGAGTGACGGTGTCPGTGAWASGERWRAAAERRAAELRLELSWPERLPLRTRQAHRVASRAQELGIGSRFALAAGRLAFCGGFDLGEPEVLLEAAAAAGLALDCALQAAGDGERDRALAANAAALRSAGISEPPAISVDGRWFAGERAVALAALQLRAHAC